MACSKLLAVMSLLVFLTACASGSHVLTGIERSAIDPKFVQVYSQAPKIDFEVVASLEATSSLGITQQDRVDSALQTIKEEAAELGANGIIISNTPYKTGVISTNVSTGISTGTNGFRSGLGTGFTIHPALIKGTAIYVNPRPISQSKIDFSTTKE